MAKKTVCDLRSIAQAIAKEKAPEFITKLKKGLLRWANLRP